MPRTFLHVIQEHYQISGCEWDRDFSKHAFGLCCRQISPCYRARTNSTSALGRNVRSAKRREVSVLGQSFFTSAMQGGLSVAKLFEVRIASLYTEQAER